MTKREPTVRELIQALREEVRAGFASMSDRLAELEAAAQKPRVARVVMPEATNGPAR